MAITLPEDVSRQAMASIKKYCAEQLEIDADDIQATMLLDFFIRELAPTAYNAGVADAQSYLRDRLADLEGACYEPEFGYWPKSGTVRRRRGD